MSRVEDDPSLPYITGDHEEDMRRLYQVLHDRFRDIARQVNALSEGKIRAHYNAHSAEPSGVVVAQGDFFMNSRPEEIGTGGNKYVLAGWTAIVDGTASAASIVQVRTPTGN